MMKTNKDKQERSDEQLQLAHKRETLLSLMVEDMKILKSYLYELKELEKDLMRIKRNASDHATSVSSKMVVSL